MSSAQHALSGERHPNKGRGFGKPFQKGVSGNPSGKRRGDKTVSQIAREGSAEAMRVLMKIMRDEKATYSVRAFCAERVLDRGVGKPVQIAAVALTAARSVKDLTDEELVAIVLGTSGDQDGPLIEGEVTRVDHNPLSGMDVEAEPEQG